MSIAQQIGRVSASIDANARSLEFARLAQAVLAHDGRFSKAQIAARASSRDSSLGPKLANIITSGAGEISREVLRQQKAAVTAGGLTASPLADYSAISSGFLNSLTSAGAFDFMLSSMTPLPFSTATVGAISVGATAYSLGEGSAKPISQLTTVNQQMTPLKAHVAIAITVELARSPLIGATQYIQTDLKNVVARQTDAVFVNALLSGITPITSSGSTGESIRADIAGMLRSVGTGQTSKLFLLVPSLVCKMWSMASNAKGQSAFEDLGPLGGVINQIPVVVTDGCPTGTAILCDASGLGAAPGEVSLQEFREGLIIAESAPDSPVTASTVVESLFQTGKVAIVVERFFCAVRLRSDAVASVFNANSWQSGNSPP